MIRIDGAGEIGRKIAIVYNPLSEAGLALDLLCKPEHHRLHSDWSESVLKALSPKEKKLLHDFEEMIEGYLNLDLHYDFLSYPLGIPESSLELGHFVQDRANRLSGLDRESEDQLASFVAFMWENYIYPVVSEHIPAVEDQIRNGETLLRKEGAIPFLQVVNDRISFTSTGDLKMEKWVDSRFSCSDLDSFFVELSLFAFPHMVIADRHDEGSFWLSWDVPFRGDRIIAPGINRISARAFALSDKSRLRILLMLSGSPMTQKELARQMGFAKSTVSRHINILLDAGLICPGEGERNVLLSLNPEAMDAFSTELSGWLRHS